MSNLQIEHIDPGKRRRAGIQTFIVFVMIVLTGAVITVQVERGRISQKKEAALTVAAYYGHAILVEINQSLSATYTLATLVQLGNGSVPDFESVASTILSHSGTISSLQLAPNGIITHIVPLAGNETALGHNLLEDPNRSIEALAAMESGALTLAGPFELIQGGIAMVGRLPIFLPGEAGEKQFWGFSTALIHLDKLIEYVELKQLEEIGYRYEISRIHPKSGNSSVFMTSAEPLQENPTVYRFSVPNGIWTLSLKPETGWLSTQSLFVEGIFVLLTSILFSFLYRMLQKQPMILRREIEIRTRELAELNQKLTSEIDVRRTAEESLRQSEKRFELAVKGSSDGLWDWFNVNEDAEWWSPRYFELLGYEVNEFEPSLSRFKELLHPDDIARTFAAVDAHFNDDIPFNIEYRLRTQSGNYRWFRARGLLLRDESGKPKRMAGSIQDIDDYRQVVQDLNNLSERMQVAVQSAKIGIFDWDVENNVLNWDDQMHLLYGVSPDEFGGAFDAWAKSVHPDDLNKANEEIELALQGKNDFNTEFRVIWSDKSVHYIKAFADVQINSEGKAVRMIGVNWDITKLKHAEAALRESEKRFRRLADSTPVLIWRSDTNKRCTYLNHGWLSFTGRAFKNDFSMGWTEGIHPDDNNQYQDRFSEAFAARKTFTMEYRLKHRHGNYRWILDIGIPLFEDNNLFCGFIGCCTDINDLKEAEADLKVAKELAEAGSQSKSDFLANISHEIRTPMNAIIGMTELALDTELSQVQKKYLATVDDAANSLLTLLNDILDFSKVEAKKVDLESINFSLKDTICHVVNTLAFTAHKKDLELTFHIPPAIPDGLIGDPGRLQQVILNLANNAIKFTEKGEVLVRVQIENELKTASLLKKKNSNPAHCVLCFSVSDTGMGISEDKMLNIFQPFFQADNSTTRMFGGTGLGLAISSQLVELMGGKIQGESPATQLHPKYEMKGSTFSFTARFGLQMNRPDDMLSSDHQAMNGKTVLVVDDNLTNREMLEELFQHWNMEVEFSSAGHSAMSLIEQRIFEETPFDVILVNQKLNDFDGITLLENINKKIQSPLCVIMMLYYNRTNDEMKRCRDAGAADYIIKPISQYELLKKIETALFQRDSVIEQQVKHPETSKKLKVNDQLLSCRSLNVLIAEDVKVNQVIAVKLLEKRGHKVHVVADGEQALKILNDQEFDVVLMDIQMPVMDGYDATLAIREGEKKTDKHIPIIALTANAMVGDREKCLEIGMDGYVSKPIKKLELYESIEQFFRSESATGTPEIGKSE